MVLQPNKEPIDEDTETLRRDRRRGGGPSLRVDCAVRRRQHSTRNARPPRNRGADVDSAYCVGRRQRGGDYPQPVERLADLAVRGYRYRKNSSRDGFQQIVMMQAAETRVG